MCPYEVFFYEELQYVFFSVEVIEIISEVIVKYSAGALSELPTLQGPTKHA